MQLSGQNRILAGFAVAVVSIALLTGCKDSKSFTEPIPLGNIAGAWTGTYSPAAVTECSVSPAQASFQQDGSAVTGTLSWTGDCGIIQVTLKGTLNGNKLSGDLLGDPFDGLTAAGTLSGTTLTITLISAAHPYDGGTLQLHQ